MRRLKTYLPRKEPGKETDDDDCDDCEMEKRKRVEGGRWPPFICGPVGEISTAKACFS